MRELYEEIRNFYILQEVGSKTPSSPIDGDSRDLNTKFTAYSSRKETNGEPLVRGHNGTVREISWNVHDNEFGLSNRERMSALTDVPHLHQHHIQNHGDVGDVYTNSPASDDENGIERSGNKRERLYKKLGGFGSEANGSQYGIVKQHPDDHPEEHLRGKKYLHPVESHEISNYKQSRKVSKMSQEERTSLLNDRTKPFEDKSYENRIHNIKKLQPHKILPGHNNLTMAQYARNASTSTIGAKL